MEGFLSTLYLETKKTQASWRKRPKPAGMRLRTILAFLETNGRDVEQRRATHKLAQQSSRSAFNVQGRQLFFVT